MELGLDTYQNAIIQERQIQNMEDQMQVFSEHKDMGEYYSFVNQCLGPDLIQPPISYVFYFNGT